MNLHQRRVRARAGWRKTPMSEKPSGWGKLGKRLPLGKTPVLKVFLSSAFFARGKGPSEANPDFPEKGLPYLGEIDYNKKEYTTILCRREQTGSFPRGSPQRRGAFGSSFLVFASHRWNPDERKRVKRTPGSWRV